MSLHVETHGNGEPLLLLHGWGMHGGVWDGVAAALAQRYKVLVADLPGHGWSGKGEGRRGTSPLPQAGEGVGEREPFSLDAIIDKLTAQFTKPLSVCGWSLGGIIAQRWAIRKPDKIRRLVLVASTPCFTMREDWLFGMAGETLRQFAAELERDHAATLRRFLALQLRGSANERELLADLHRRLFSRGEPDMDALRGGLEILRNVDLRGDLASIRQPVLVMAGARDKLTPPEASHYLAQILPHASLVEIEGAAHAPFLSYPDIFVEQVVDFMNEPV